MALGGHHLIPSIPKQLPLDCGIAVAPPKLVPASDLVEDTFLSAHYFGAFHALQLPRDVCVFESKHWALSQIRVNI